MRFTARHGRFHKGNASRLGKLGAAANARKRMENPHETFLHPTPQAEARRTKDFMNEQTEANKRQRPTDVASGAVLGGWRDISTAPTHKHVLLWWRTCTIPSVGIWSYDEDAEREGWRCDGDQCVPKNQHDCLYWHELPKPPNDGR